MQVPTWASRDLSRRNLLGGAAGLMLAPASSRAGAAPSLGALAARKGIRFGAAVAYSAPGADKGSFANPAYAALLDAECRVLVPENELKWQQLRPSATEFNFTQIDAIAAYAAAKRMRWRGHTLFWAPEQWFPKWLKSHDFGPRPAAAAERMLVEHVERVCGRYGDAVYSYDVVNEAVEPATGALRDTVVTRAMGGEAMLDCMFHAARRAAPKAELVYNDYMSWERGTEDETHIKGVLRLLEGFRKRGTPVDTLGIQSHIRLLKDVSVASIVQESERPWSDFIDAVVAMGYRIVITEFDVNDRRTPSDIAIRDQRVADYARAYLDLMFSYPQLGDFLCWGLSDRYSWLPGFDPRPDGLPQRGLPFDANFQPKPLRAAIAASLQAAPARPRTR